MKSSWTWKRMRCRTVPRLAPRKAAVMDFPGVLRERTNHLWRAHARPTVSPDRRSRSHHAVCDSAQSNRGSLEQQPEHGALSTAAPSADAAPHLLGPVPAERLDRRAEGGLRQELP